MISATIAAIVLSPAPAAWTLTRSQNLKPGEKLIASASLDRPALKIRGNNLVVDGRDFVLRGTPATTWPDQRKGLGIRVEGKNITLRNLNVHGYKVALMAENVSGLKIENCDFSYNWKQRLKSEIEKESLDDWMSFHQNEKDEWLRFGAAIYLKGCNAPEVKGVRVTGGQCALMMTRVEKAKVWNNDFRFNSAIGIGMYRTSNCQIMHNRIDFCVRGHSEGYYNRGQDSAGILIYEQSHRNLFAYNSATHSGDGFFLWAGQSTMDTGQGGCNDNLLYGNDFSYAPTNGIEATFSRNRFVNNRVDECWHGFWLGYSYESIVRGNFGRGCTEGIAWEHGQKNVIDGNDFANETDISLWQNVTQDPNWGYPKHRDTASHGYEIYANRLGGKVGLKLRDTRDVTASENRFGGTIIREGNTDGLQILRNEFVGRLPEGVTESGENRALPTPMQAIEPTWAPSRDAKFGRIRNVGGDPAYDEEPAPLPGGLWPFRSNADSLNGRRYIIVDEWGPYDFRRPILWPRKDAPDRKLGADSVKYTILGPAGKWRMVNRRGFAKVSAEQGSVPGSIEVVPATGGVVDQLLELEYVGKETTDVRGIVTPAGKPVRFQFARYEIPIQWAIEWREWDAKTSDPRTQATEFEKLMATPAVATATASKLSYDWYNSPARGKVGSDYFFTLANGNLEVPKAKYELEVTTDDGCRVWLDDKLVLDKWFYQGPTTYTVPVNLGGKHRLRVRHFEINGFSCLKVKLNRAK